VPELRIVDDELWDAVKRRQASIRESEGVSKARATRFWERRRAQHLLTGLVYCGSCGGRMASVGRDYLACSAARGRGTCTNRASIRRGPLEELILEGLRHNLMTGKQVEAFIAAFHAELNTQRAARTAGRAGQERELAVHRLTAVRRRFVEACSLLRDWYAAELGVSKPPRILLDPFTLSSDQFVEQIRKARGVRKPLSAAAVHAVREEYAQTVQPMQAALREAERLEWRLSDLVNEAYGLTPEEVRLMWATAPPRMPLTPESGLPDQAEDEAAA
jgi:hypothetical protein